MSNALNGKAYTPVDVFPSGDPEITFIHFDLAGKWHLGDNSLNVEHAQGQQVLGRSIFIHN